MDDVAWFEAAVATLAEVGSQPVTLAQDLGAALARVAAPAAATDGSGRTGRVVGRPDRASAQDDTGETDAGAPAYSADQRRRAGRRPVVASREKQDAHGVGAALPNALYTRAAGYAGRLHRQRRDVRRVLWRAQTPRSDPRCGR
jgi:hypothetical protein